MKYMTVSLHFISGLCFLCVIMEESHALKNFVISALGEGLPSYSDPLDDIVRSKISI